jgi:hypothetical protein
MYSTESVLRIHQETIGKWLESNFTRAVAQLPPPMTATVGCLNALTHCKVKKKLRLIEVYNFA